MTIRSIAGVPALRHAKIAAMAAIAILLSLNGARAAGDPVRGATLYQGCGDAGTVAGYNYSPALKNSKIVWTEANLDKWLSGPDAMVPGTKMFYEVQDPKDRADIIAFLKEKAK